MHLQPQSAASWRCTPHDAPCPPAVCTALTAICKLISPDLINAVLPKTIELLTHPRELVRKKAVMALHRRASQGCDSA